MLLLPQLLYLLRTLPFLVPNSFISTVQSLTDRYLWHGKQARCAFDKLVASRKVGGVNHVLLKDYYTALILTQLKTWFPQSHGMRWKKLERSQIIGNNLYDLLMSNRFNPHSITTLSLTIIA